MSRKALAWMLAILSVLVISLGFTPYSQTANYLLISIRLAGIAVLSILFVRERWRHRNPAVPDAGDSVLRRLRTWYYDERSHGPTGSKR